MNVKRLALIGVLALVVIGCVVAAGCTSTQTTTTSDSIVGSWGYIDYGVEQGIHVNTFFADGNGKEVVTYVDGTDVTYPFTWKKTGEKVYLVSYEDGEIWSATYVNPDEELVWKEIKSTPDKIVGTHKSTYTNSDGKDVEFVSVFKADQTGSATLTLEDNTKKNYNMTWKQIGTDEYIVISENDSRWVVTYTPAKLSYKKVDYSGEPVIGSATDTYTYDGKSITVTNVTRENGTGAEIWELANGLKQEFPYVWDKTDENTYLVSYVDCVPFEQWIVEYNPKDKSQDWTLFTFMWVDNYQDTNGHVVDTHLIHNDSANGIAVEHDVDGTTTTYKTQWSFDGFRSYTITYEDGEAWTATWNTDTKTYDWKQISTATTTTTTTTSDDQILGTWVKEDGSAAFVIATNNDGTYYTVKDNAIDEETPIIWKKNTDGTYALISGMGTATVKLDAVKGQFTTDSGSVFVKLASDTSGWNDFVRPLIHEYNKVQ